MNVGDLEDAFFSFIDWCSAESLNTSEASSEQSSVLAPASVKDEIIREYLIGDWQNVQAQLTELKSRIGTHKEALLKYVVGVDDQHMLDTICETTSQSLSFLLDDEDENPGFKEGLEQTDLEARISTCTDNLQHVEGLHVEGSGGAEHEEDIRLYQLAHYLIHTIRDLLDVMTRLFGYQSKRNNMAETVIHRPFFFQVPCSPQELINIRQARDDLKDVLEQVNQKQEALDSALHKQIYIDNGTDESVYSDDGVGSSTTYSC